MRPALAAALAAAPVFAQHREVAKRHGFVRAAGEMAVWSATFSSWLDPGPDSLLPHTGWLHDAFEDREPLFPGSVFLIAGALGLTAWGRRRNWALCAAELSLTTSSRRRRSPAASRKNWR